MSLTALSCAAALAGLGTAGGILWHYGGLPPGAPPDAVAWLVLVTLGGAALGGLMAWR